MIINQQPSAINFSGNLRDIVITNAAPVSLKLMQGAALIIEEIYSPDAANKITIRLKDIIDGLLSSSVPTTDVFHQNQAYANYTAIFNDTESITFLVIKGGVDADLVDAELFTESAFLTWQPQQKVVKFHDPEWITYYAKSASVLKAKGYNASTSQTVTLAALPAGQLTSVNVNYGHLISLFTTQPLYIDVWVEVSGAVKSYVQRYILSADEFEFEDIFVFENSLGGIDTIRLSGEKQTNENFKFDSALFDESVADYSVTPEQVFEKNTGYFNSERERFWSLDFFSSLKKYHNRSGSLRKIIVTKPALASVEGEIADYKFNFAYSKQTNYLNLPRQTSLPAALEFIGPDQELFFLAPNLNLLPTANFDSNWLLPIHSPFGNTWNKLSIGSLRNYLSTIIGASFPSSVNFALNSDHANYADLALNAQLWNSHNFSDYLNQALRTVDAVKFKSIASPGYTGGFTGNGFFIDENANATFDNLTVRKQFNIFELVLNKISGTNGALAVTDTIKVETVAETLTGYNCTIDTAGNTIAVPFQLNDLLRCQVWNGLSVKYYVAKVTSVGVGTFTLDKATKSGAGIPAAGDTLVHFGNTTNTNRQGLLYLTASDSNAPYLDVLDGINSDDLTGKTKARLGKLDGITDTDFGQLSGYGLYGENVFLKNGKFKGEIIVTGGNAETTTGSQLKANAAQLAATNASNLYAAAQSALELEVAKAYADGKVTAEEQARINQAVANLAEAKTDATAKANAALVAAGSDATAKANAAQTAATNAGITYAAAQAAYEREIAKAYADGKITAEELARINQAAVNLAEAKADATAKANAAKAEALSLANIYASSQASIAQAAAISTASADATSKANNAYSTALSAAQTYAVTAANSASSQAQINAAADALSKANTAYNNAIAYANSQYSNLTTALKSMAYQDVVEVAKLGTSIMQGAYFKGTLIDADYIRANIINVQYLQALDIVANTFSTPDGRITININGDNSSKYRHLNGNLGIRIGTDSGGNAIFEYYNQGGVKVFELGPNGQVYASIVPESWSSSLLRFWAAGSGNTLTDAEKNTIIALIKNSASGYATSEGDNSGPFPTGSLTINANITTYLYLEGSNSQSAANAQYKGMHTAQFKSTSNFIADGWYLLSGPASIATSLDYTFEEFVIYANRYVSGQQTATAELRVNFM
jgi:hypothetical protein